MTEHPDVLSKLQAEVDRVCGTERMPSVKDASNLPYTRAVMNEVRLCLFTPLQLLTSLDPEMETRRTGRSPSSPDSR